MENNEQFNDPTMMDSSVGSSYEGTPNGTEKAFAVLAYFGLLWLIGLLKAPENESPYVKNHVNNGIVLTIVGVASGIIAAIPVIGWIVSGVVGVASLVFAIIGIVKACQNTTYILPLIGDKFVLVK